ncbi:MAG TPA: cell division protein ZapB [Thermoanaerobaculia bacterium]|nr:cell division protein ZapB [Thermoanaerobaculia bacterium]
MTAPAGAPWLDALESRVRDAVERVGTLAAENRRLAARVEELEDRLAQAPEGGDAGAAAEAAGWRRDRAEVERRVRKLVETLESLLDNRSEAD